MSKFMRKIVIAIFVLTMAVAGADWYTKDDVLAADSSTSVSYKMQEYSGTKVLEYKNANKAPKLAEGDWIFSGWFCDEKCNTALVGSAVEANTYYAKFVPSEVLSVKCQVKKNTTVDTTKSDMRLVSTVDSLNYKNVGFEVYYNGATTPIIVNTTKVYERIVANSDGVDYEFGPKIFDSDADYFVTATLVNIANSNFEKTFYIKPYWETLDGTKVYGISRYARVEDSYLNIVNIPIRVCSDTVVAAGGVVIDYDETNFSYVSEGYGTKVTVPYNNGDVFETVTTLLDNGDGSLTYFGETATAKAADGTLVHLRFQMTDPKTMPKTNTFTVASEQFANDAVVTLNVADVIYKNFNGGNTGVADTSWYDADESAFVLTSKDELLGFAEKSKATNFVGKTIYLGADIELNAGNATDWAEAAPANAWIPIGSTDATLQFAGTFDGQGHTISGLYYSQNDNNFGMFKKVAQSATITNFTLSNSYLSSATKTGNTHLGAIAGSGAGTYSNIHIDQDVIIESLGGGIGGIIGCVNIGGKTAIQNCWFDGTIIIGTSADSCGGFIGYTTYNTGTTSAEIQLTDCLATGTMQCDSTSTTGRFGGFIGGMIGASGSTTCPKVEMTRCLGDINFTTTLSKMPTTNIGTIVGIMQYASAGTTLTAKVDGGVYVVNNAKVTNKLGNASALASNATVVENFNNISEVNDRTDLYDFEAYSVAADLGYYDDYTGKSATGAWVARNNNTPALKTFVSTGLFCKPDTSWYEEPVRTEADGTKVYVIDTVAEFYGLAALSKTEDFAGEKIELGADLNINKGEASEWANRTPQNQWLPIGWMNGAGAPFAGTFDGQGHTISGAYVLADNNLGLFGKVASGSKIQKLNLTNSYIESTSSKTGNVFLGSIVGSGVVTLDTIYTDAIITSHGAGVGGFVGCMNINNGAAKITNCWFDGTINMLAGYHGGGFVGCVGHTTPAAVELTVEHSLYSGNLTYKGTNTYRVGGLFGFIRNGSQVNLKDSVVIGEIASDTTSKIGAVVGEVGSDSKINVTEDAPVYAAKTCYGTVIGSGSSYVTGSTYIYQTNNENVMYGANAYINAPKLDYYNAYADSDDGHWVARILETPMLKSFAEGSIFSKADTSWYNEPARIEEDGTEVYVLDSEEDFNGFAVLSISNNFEGQKIELVTDIVLNEGKAVDWESIAPQNRWSPIGGINAEGKPFAGIFDGLGHTISGVYVLADNNLGLFGKTTGTAVLKNFRLENSYMASSSNKTGDVFIGGIVGSGGGTFDTIYTDAIVTTYGRGIGGFVGCVRGTGVVQNVFTNCWFDGTLYMRGKSYHGGGLVGSIGVSGTGVNVNINNCLYTGAIDYKSTGDYTRLGGLFGISFASTVSISDCIIDGTIKSSVSSSQIGTVIGLIGANSAISVESGNDVYSTKDTYTKATVGTYNNTLTGAEYIHLIEDETTLHGTTAKTTASALDFTSYWKTVEESTPVLKCFEIDKRWYTEAGEEAGTKENPYVISNVAELYGLSEISQTYNFSGKVIELAADITVNKGKSTDWAATAPEKAWTPIGTTSAATQFAGTFDGKGHTISGIYVTGQNNLGLFKRTAQSAVIKDFRLENSYLASTSDRDGVAVNIGAITGSGAGIFENIYTNAIVSTHGLGIGGFIGGMSTNGTTATIRDSWFAGTINMYGGSYHAGGFVGTVGYGTTATTTLNLENCLNTSVINHSANATYTRIGGLCGAILNGSTVNMKDCLGVGTLQTDSTSSQIGSLIGLVGTSSFVNIEEFDDSYGTKDIGSSAIGQGTDRVTGLEYVHELDDKKDLYGYGSYLYTTSLDFDNAYANAAGNGSWLLREGTYPIPVCFESADDVRVDLSCFVLDGTSEPAAMVDFGDGNYVITVSETEKTYYDSYISKLVGLGFTKHSDNGDTGLDNGAVYTAIYQKDTLSLTLTCVTNTKTTYISAAANQAVSKYLVDTVSEDGGDATNGTVSLSMLSLEEPAGGNFIMQLENGHFVLYDMAQTKVDYANMLAYMKTLTGGEKPVIDALILSHAHTDHYGILRHMDSDGNGVADDLFVQGVYYSMPSEATFTATQNGLEHMTNIENGVKKLRMTDGETMPEVYRIQTGQKYYFDGITMDVMFTQEQLSGYADFNEASSWCMFTIGTEKVLMGADAGQISMRAVMDMYSANYLYSDIFSGLHHGVNTWNDFTNYCKTNTIANGKAVDDVVLYSRKLDPTDSSSYTVDELGDLLKAYLVSSYVKTLNGAVNKGVNGKTHFYYGQGTIRLNFTESGITSEIIATTTE